MSRTPTMLPMAAAPPPATAPSPAAPPPPAAAAEPGELEALAARLDTANARRAELDPLPRQVITDVVDALDALHKAGLTAIVRRLREDPRGKELLFELVDDPTVRMLLGMHGIIRTADPMTVATRVLDTVRPGIQSHGGDVELVAIEDGVAQVRLQGACNGCSMASVTMREGVEKALVEGVPGITSVLVLPNEPAAPEPAALLQITQVGTGRPDAEVAVAAAPVVVEGAGWVKTFPVERIGVGTLEAMSLRPDEGETVEVVVVNAAGQMAAYVNACAHQGMPLDNAIVDAESGTLTCPWHGFCFDAASGECLTMPGAQLEQLPLRIDDGHIWVRTAA